MTYAEHLGWEAVAEGADPLTLQDLVPQRWWDRDALCREPQYAEMSFFIERGESSAPAKAVCFGCLVRVECLQDALADPVASDYGIRGGTSARERQRMRRTHLADAA